MFEWMNRHKQNIMKYTLYLVIPSFVLLYGYGECAKPESHQWVAKVNGETITEFAFNQWVDTIQNQIKRMGQGTDLTYDEIRQQALEMAILTTIYEQKAEEWGIATTDEELLSNIQQIPAFQNENGVFDANRYRGLLAANQIHPLQFEQEQRENLTRTKVQSVIRNSVFRSATDKEQFNARQNNKALVEFLSFEPAAFTEQVEPATDAMMAFFEENKEDYRVAEKRKIGYVRFFPSEYVKDVSPTEREVERFFEQNQQKYEIPEQVRVDYITYTSDAFKDRVPVDDAAIQAYYEDNQDQFMSPERARVRFAKLNLNEIAAQEAVSEEEIKAFYDANLTRYTHDVQVKARHILLRVEKPEDDEAVLQKIQGIRQEILEGLSFDEAAKKYSDDTYSAKEGGDLGYFEKNRMVEPFANAAFDLPLGQMSEPVKTTYGYHLILVEGRKEKGTDSLDEVKDSIKEQLQKGNAIQVLREKATAIASLEDVSTEYSIQTTDWIARGDQIPNVGEQETLSFFSVAIRDVTETVRFLGYPSLEWAYFIEPLEKQAPAPLALEEAREKVVEAFQTAKAADIANEAAAADGDRIVSASMTLEQIAEERKLEIKVSELFAQDAQFLPEFGQRPVALISAAFGSKEGEVKGPFETAQGSVFIRLKVREAAHLPEFATVKDQAEQDFIQDRAEHLARSAAVKFADTLYDQHKSLENGAVENGIEYVVSDFFAQTDAIPGLGYKQELNQAAFESLERKGHLSDAIEVRFASPRFQQTQQEMPVDAYYIITLVDIQNSHLPTFEEALADVEKNYRLVLAEDVAVAEAQRVLDLVKAKVAEGQPVSATQTLELKTFAKDSETAVSDKATYHAPAEISGMGSVPGIGRALSLAKTALAMKEGQISGLVKNHGVKMDEDGNREQGPLTGVYILQNLGKVEPKEEETANLDRFNQMFDMQVGSAAFSAWIDEASAASKIETNDAYLRLRSQNEEETEDSLEGTESVSS